MFSIKDNKSEKLEKALSQQLQSELNEPEINELFQRYKKWKGIPVWCPLSDGERHEFEFMVLRAMQKKAEREG